MVLPDGQDSGKFAGVKSKSNFSQTCSLLSKYIKEKGTFPDLKLALTTNFEPTKGPQYNTVNLLGGVGNETEKKSEANSPAPTMTIFYAGQVIVFDDFPADKAKELVMLATKASDAAAISASVASMSPTESDLPIARKKSLSRFLEKRKDRIITNAPYQTSKPAAGAPAKVPKGEEWLGMAPSLGQWSNGL